MNINDRLKRDTALQRRLYILLNQVQMYGALRDAAQTLYFASEVGRRGAALLIPLGREIIINCEQIWELSGPDRLAPDQGTAPREDEIADDLPF